MAEELRRKIRLRSARPRRATLVVVPELALVVVTTAKADVDFATSDTMFEELSKVVEAVVSVAH